MKFLILTFLLIAAVSSEPCVFADYVKTFNKLYSPEEYEFHEAIFAVKCNQAMTAEGLNYTLSVNRFTDLNETQLANILKPIQISSDAKVSTSFDVLNSARNDSINGPKVRSIATSLDYNALGMISGIKDQGNCGCCWAFAATAAYESTLAFHGFPGYILSEQYCLECVTPFINKPLQTSDCSGGYVLDAFQLLAAYGTVQRSVYPYVAGNFGSSAATPKTPNICTDTSHLKVGTTSALYLRDVSQDQLKILLNTYGPVGVAIYANTGFMAYKSGVYSGCPPNSYLFLNHAVLVYGYDKDGNWLIKNQWGTGWGQNGFMRISPTLNCGLNAFVFVYNVQTVASAVQSVILNIKKHENNLALFALSVLTVLLLA